MEVQVISVTQLLYQIKGLLASSFKLFWIEGEVTNFSKSGNGHYYFSLSDKDSLVPAVLFKGDAIRNSEITGIKDGLKVRCLGEIGLYQKRGNLQVICKRIVPVGKGDFKEQFEKLKQKLANEGLFDLERKKKIPPWPKRVAVITALDGAALRDFLSVYKRRSPFMNILIIPAIVQGDAAAPSLIKAFYQVIKYHQSIAPVDVIVFTRGGGSLEDLCAFNDEGLAWEIYNSPIPVISAIGHEVDFSICDFVADLRCETPTAAAETLTQLSFGLSIQLSHLKKQLFHSINQRMMSQKQDLTDLSPHKNLDRIRRKMNSWYQQLSVLNPLYRIKAILPIQDLMLRLDDSARNLKQNVLDQIEENEARIQESYKLLEVLNPQNTLERGYSYISNKEGLILKRKKEFDKLKQGEAFCITFSDGKVPLKTTK